MARIRSDKPEAYQSETLAEISLAAERTFKGMATIADDNGRLADKPAQINGSSGRCAEITRAKTSRPS